MIRKLVFLAFAAMTMVNAWADNRQTVTINGVAQSQSVKRITFSGDDAVVLFADNSQQTVDLSTVKISFVYDDVPNRVDRVETPADAVKEQKGVYNLNGQFMGHRSDNLPKGVYIINGRKEVVK